LPSDPPNSADAEHDYPPELSRLPPGRHGLPREFVVHNQRERLIAGLAEAVAEHGYSGTTIAHITAHAAVSRRTFYEHASASTAPTPGPLAPALRTAALAVAAAFEAEEAKLTALDAQAGDGDLGISMVRGAAALRALPQPAWADPPTALAQMGETLRRAIAGSSGPFYATALLRAARIFLVLLQRCQQQAEIIGLDGWIRRHARRGRHRHRPRRADCAHRTGRTVRDRPPGV